MEEEKIKIKTEKMTGNHAESQRDLAPYSVFRPPVAGGLITLL